MGKQKVLKSVVMDAQLRIPPKHGFKYFKRVDVIVYYLYLNKDVIKKFKGENLGLGISKYILMIIIIRIVRLLLGSSQQTRGHCCEGAPDKNLL